MRFQRPIHTCKPSIFILLLFFTGFTADLGLPLKFVSVIVKDNKISPPPTNKIIDIVRRYDKTLSTVLVLLIFLPYYITYTGI